MADALSHEAFFLDAPSGRLFGLYIGPHRPKRAFLLAPPFAEELNKCRRMISEQARAFARQGTGVLVLDLYGTGDSDGELADATWALWCNDLVCGCEWLEQRAGCPVGVWGVRLGALLGLEVARRRVDRARELVLWQPVLRGEAQVTEFLRLKIASEMMNRRGSKLTTGALRESLASGETLEIAGYQLSPELAAGLDAQVMMSAPECIARVAWLHVQRAKELPLPPPVRKGIQAWRETGVEVVDRCVTGETFWNTQEIEECPALIEATIEACTLGKRNLAGRD